MATYEEIYGKRVKEFDSDPTLESSYEGQVWYDKSTGVLKSVVAFESTSSTSPMNTARVQGAGGGIQTDGFGAGGYTTTNVATTEEYNGTGFSAGGDLGSARRAMGGTGQTPAGRPGEPRGMAAHDRVVSSTVRGNLRTAGRRL